MARPNKGKQLAFNKERGVYEVRWSEDGRSKRVSTRTSDREEATRFLAAFVLELDKEESRERAEVSGGARMGEILDLYLAEHVEGAGLDGDGVADKVRQRNVIRCLRPFFQDMRPADITPTIVAKYREGRIKGTTGLRVARSSSTHRRELNCLIAAINYAVARRVIRAEDTLPIKLPKESAPRDLWLTEEESFQFQAAAQDRGRTRGAMFVMIASHTASRRRAVETLTWEQIDLDAGLIDFNPPGRRQTNKRRVAVPINKTLAAYLELTPPHLRTGYVLGDDKPVLRAVEVIARHAYRQTGNPKFLRVTPHVLRHTWATLAARAGADLYEIAGVMGDSLVTIQKTYLKHCPDHLRKAVALFDGAGRAPATPHRLRVVGGSEARAA